MHYIAGFPKHPMHRALTALPDDESRLRAVITGLPGDRAGVPLLESMAERLDAYLGWLDAPGVLAVRFEDLVGARGGGDVDRQRALIRDIGAHVGRSLSADDAERIASVVWSPSSSTFRRGAMGDWRRHFTDDHTALVKSTAGRQLLAMGYEHDMAW
jgi:sulfotransferase 6B1